MRIVPQAVHALIIIAVMEIKDSFVVRRATWVADRPVLAAIRREVFVVEQHVPESEEWDSRDAVSEHVIALASDGSAIGTGRLLPDGHIGRMAVLKAWRGCGVGSALLTGLIAMARERGFSETRLHAQTHALAFYSKHGYTPLGDEFMEAGIPHVEMRLVLKPSVRNGA
jgi:predicted GNAT family N-acyltransferase